MLEILTPDEMAAADARAINAGPHDGYGLMLNAGLAVAREALRRFADAPRFHVLCGPGNNGGDGFVVARLLKDLDWNVRVLFLDDIPQLSRRNFNEARRFVTLIDALYEAKVRLIASAAAKPEMLYVEGDGVFEFERTASRLREMQSDDWGRAADAVA